MIAQLEQGAENLGQWYKAVPTALNGAILNGLEAKLSKYHE